jgi:hypothetical protein
MMPTQLVSAAVTMRSNAGSQPDHLCYQLIPGQGRKIIVHTALTAVPPIPAHWHASKYHRLRVKSSFWTVVHSLALAVQGPERLTAFAWGLTLTEVANHGHVSHALQLHARDLGAHD